MSDVTTLLHNVNTQLVGFEVFCGPSGDPVKIKAKLCIHISETCKSYTDMHLDISRHRNVKDFASILVSHILQSVKEEHGD
jgi:hypothetical protein